MLSLTTTGHWNITLIFLEHLPDLFPEIFDRYPELAGMIQVRELENMFCWLDAVRNRCVAGITF